MIQNTNTGRGRIVHDQNNSKNFLGYESFVYSSKCSKECNKLLWLRWNKQNYTKFSQPVFVFFQVVSVINHLLKTLSQNDLNIQNLSLSL
jgi:hypothetical protein